MNIRHLMPFLESLLLVAGLQVPVHASDLSKFRLLDEPQFIAALGDAGAASGNGAQSWGFWSQDPGPRACKLDRYPQLKAAGGVAPSQWKFDAADWWLEEHGLIMEKPTFPLPAGKYLVTGDRKVTTVLTIQPKDKQGSQRWELADGATLYDVTHLGCRSARYTPATANHSCSPANVRTTGFPVDPGGAMARGERLPKAGLHGAYRRWTALHSLSGRVGSVSVLRRWDSLECNMSYRFSAMLHIPGDVRDAIAFYGRAFGAETGWSTPPAADMVAQLLVQGVEFWVHPAGEDIGNPSPAQLGGTAVRLMLIVDDPDAVFDQAVAAGAVVRSAMQDREYGWREGCVVDPSGHRWEIGKPL